MDAQYHLVVRGNETNVTGIINHNNLEPCFETNLLKSCGEDRTCPCFSIISRRWNSFPFEVHNLSKSTIRWNDRQNYRSSGKVLTWWDTSSYYFNPIKMANWHDCDTNMAWGHMAGKNPLFVSPPGNLNRTTSYIVFKRGVTTPAGSSHVGG